MILVDPEVSHLILEVVASILGFGKTWVSPLSPIFLAVRRPLSGL